jgi:mono/diheme cytochrome c family protein
MWRLAPISPLLVILTVSAYGQDGPGNAKAGLALARRDCASCHIVEGPPRSETDPFPAFVSVAREASTTEMSLRVFLQSMHPSMPDIMLSREEEADIVTYILSLKRSPAGQ